MAKFDGIYNNIIKKINAIGCWDEEARPKYADGTTAYTKSIINEQIKFDVKHCSGLLTTKRVPMKDPIQELFWIWKWKTNSVDFLSEYLKCKVWNEWKRPDGTIGKAYGWQLANKFRTVKLDAVLMEMIIAREVTSAIAIPNTDCVKLDQVDYMLYMVKANPFSRRIKTTLWCVEDLDDMSLEPCVYETHWQTWNGKLNLTVNVRSNDMGLGNPYNVYQYTTLLKMVAQVTGREAGEICFNIDNAHVYDRHIEPLIEQVERECYAEPTVWINPNVTSFYEFTIDDIKVTGYEHGERVPLEVAI